MKKPKILPSREWLATNTAWRLKVLDLLKEWVIRNGQGPYDSVTHKVVVKRMAELEKFLRFLDPNLHPAPIAVQDAAGLIVIPKGYALHLSRKMFGARTDVADVRAFNLDWFLPKEFEP